MEARREIAALSTRRDTGRMASRLANVLLRAGEASERSALKQGAVFALMSKRVSVP
jgi:hypothetical protein